MIGKGGMGEVYEALEESLGRKVALKIISTSSSNSEKLLNQFIQEARALAQLNHKNVVTIYRLGQDHAEGEYYIAMEFIEGITLSQGIKENRFQFKDMVVIIRQIISGLKAVHAADIIHRDLKPKNIIIQTKNQVKIVDFGVAEALMGENSAGKKGEAVGTINYLSPEVLSGSRSSRQSDIWSAGIIFYELFTGMSPFRANTEAGIREEVKTLKISWPVSTKVWLPDDLKKVVMRMCAHSVEERYQTIEEVYADLLKISSGKKLDSKTRQYSFNSKSGGFKTEVTKSEVHESQVKKSYLINNKSISGSEGDVYSEFERVNEEGFKNRSWIFVLGIASILVAGYFQVGKSYLNSTLLKLTQNEVSVQEEPLVESDQPKEGLKVIDEKALSKNEKLNVENEIEKISKPISIVDAEIKGILSFTKMNDEKNVSEIENAIENPIELSWSYDGSAEKYEIYISEDKEFTKTTKYFSRAKSYLWKGAKPGKFYWRVRPVEDNKEGSYSNIGKINLYMGSPKLEVNYKEIKYLTKKQSKQVSTKIDWPAQPYVYGYHVLFSKNKNFKSILMKKSVSENFVFLKVKAGVKYYIKVASIDDQGKILSSYSSPKRVEVSIRSTLATPQNESPRNLASIENKPSVLSPLLLRWTKVIGAQRYEVQVSKQKSFRNNILSARSQSLDYSISNPLPSGKVYWRVRALAGQVYSKWSKTRTIIIP